MQKSKSHLFFILFAILFCMGYILISFHNCYQSDDMGFVWVIRSTGGVWNAFKYNYASWETTYNSLLLFWIIKWTTILPPFVFNLLTFLINIISFYLFLKSLNDFYKFKISDSVVFVFSILIIGITYFACRASGNVVYWVTGQLAYCLFLSYLFLGLHFWIKGKLLVASVCMFLFAHTRINYDAIFIALYTTYLLHELYKHKTIFKNWKRRLPFLFFVAGLITYIIIPGNYKRVESVRQLNGENHLTIILLLKGWFWMFESVASTLLFNWKQLIIPLIGCLFGLYFQDNPRLKRIINIRLLIVFVFGFILSCIAQSTIVNISIGQAIGYDRIFFFLDILLFILLLFLGLYFGIRIKLKSINSTLIYMISFLVLFSVGFFYYQNFKTTRIFAKAYDNRINELLALKKRDNIQKIYLDRLPDSGVLQFMEISPEPPDTTTYLYDNIVYGHYYQLPFKIYLKN